MMNNVRKFKDYKKQPAKKSYKNNFETKHPDLAEWMSTKGDGPFFRYCQMLAKSIEKLNRLETMSPCDRYFHSTKNRRLVGGVLNANFWKAIAEGNVSVGTSFSEFTTIGDFKTIKTILDECVSAGFIYKEKPSKHAKHWNAKFVYFPTPVMIESWMKIAEQKINSLHEINISQIMAEINDWDNKNTNTILDNHFYHAQFCNLLETEIANMDE